MAKLDIGQTTSTDLTNAQDAYSVNSESTDGITGTKTEYTNSDWETQLGYYKSIPELAIAIDTKATWTVGKGFKATPLTTLMLNNIRGWGKDTFNTILENAIRTYYIGGDFFAEIIRNEEEQVVNLKPLPPETITIEANKQGIITGYSQKSKIDKNKKTWSPEKIFHLARNRVADEIHGVSCIDNLETIILALNEATADMKTLMHRHVKPMRIWKVDTENATKIANFKTSIDDATNKAENIIIPKDTVEHELVSVATNATLNPLPWIESLKSRFFQAVGVPEIVVGGTGGVITEASAKIAYLAFQQTIEEEQLFIEEQVALQLGMLIELEFPASLENELLSDKAKDGAQNIQPNETTAGSGQ